MTLSHENFHLEEMSWQRKETLSLPHANLRPATSNMSLTFDDQAHCGGQGNRGVRPRLLIHSFLEPSHRLGAGHLSHSPACPTPKLQNEQGRIRDVSIKAEQNPRLCVVAGWALSSPLTPCFSSSPEPPPSPSWEEVWSKEELDYSLTGVNSEKRKVYFLHSCFHLKGLPLFQGPSLWSTTLREGRRR